MRTVLLTLFSIVYCCQSFGQSYEANVHDTDSRLCFKFLPLSLIDPYCGPSVRIGAEFKVRKNKAIYGELGSFLPESMFQSDELRRNKGLTIRSEMKFYLNDSKYTVGDYISVALFYKYQAFGTSDTINLQPKYVRGFDVSKHIFALDFNFGTMSVIKCGFVFDASIGAGARVRIIESGLNDEENNNIISESDYNTNIITHKAGRFIYPNIIVGLKIGYKFK